MKIRTYILRTICLVISAGAIILGTVSFWKIFFVELRYGHNAFTATLSKCGLRISVARDQFVADKIFIDGYVAGPFQYPQVTFMADNLYCQYFEKVNVGIKYIHFQHYRYNAAYASYNGSGRNVSLVFPVYLVALIGVLPVRSMIRERKLRSRKQEGCCILCGYDLRATPDQCPECGLEVFKPAM